MRLIRHLAIFGSSIPIGVGAIPATGASAIERTQMARIRAFRRWFGTIDGVDPELRYEVRVRTGATGEHARGGVIDSEPAERMFGYLERFDYASRGHPVVSLLWHTTTRRGAIRALDMVCHPRWP